LLWAPSLGSTVAKAVLRHASADIAADRVMQTQAGRRFQRLFIPQPITDEKKAPNLSSGRGGTEV
tara:strand:+ start:249 stop:443 length:195 start_codon:yes stop_codon:yes gene_type:complete